MTIGSGAAEASTTCGLSNGHTLCVAVRDTPLTGDGIYSIRIVSTSRNGADCSTKEGAAGFAPRLVVAVNQWIPG